VPNKEKVMRYTTRVCGGVFAFGLAVLWSGDARAVPIGPYCGDYCSSCVYTPAAYTGGANGDVALDTVASNPTVGSFLGAIEGPIGLKYVHTKILSDSTGNHFTETFPSVMPPSSKSTGDAHECSRPIDPFYLQDLSPGASNSVYEDAEPGELVKAFGRASCSVAANGYHINSFLHDDVTGGSCEKLLVDECGVPVSPTLDRQVYDERDAINALTALWTDAYDACLEVIGSAWPPLGIGCGGTGQTTACQRAGWQVVNEVLYKAYPAGYINKSNPTYGYEAGLLSPDGVDYYEDGWSDFHGGAPPVWGASSNPPPGYDVWTGKTMMGGAKLNYQSEPTQETMCPGACNNGGCNNPPVPCEPWAPTAWTANAPDNIAYAATRLGARQQTVVSGSGITAGYNTCKPYYCCIE
jgi:hypothetical protein